MTVAVALRQDPPRCADGRCANPGCTKKLPTGPPKTMPKALRGMFMEALASNVFCSSKCAREWHGNPEPAESIWALHHGVGS